VPNEPTNISQKLEKLRQSFFDGLPVRLQKIEQTALLLGAANHQEQLDSLIIAFHSLAGTSSTYGYMDISKHAKAAERYLNEQGHIDLAELTDKLHIYIAAINLDIEENNYEQLARQVSHELSAHLELSTTVASDVLIYLVDDDESLLNEISTLLINAGYQTKTFSQLSALETAIQKQLPSVLIVDIVFADDQYAGTNFVAHLHEKIDLELPVIFLSDQDSLEYRFRAQQAGGTYYLQKPVNFSELIHTIELLISLTFREPYRVLIVDDDAEHATYTAHTLQQIGIKTGVVLDPELTLETIQQFKPEVILQDMHMPVYSGLELAAMIRMDPKQQFTSILFLSAETQLDKHLEALRLGADDFLVKPVSPNILIQTVQIRAQRTRSYNKAFNELGKVVNELEHFKIALDQHAIVSIADLQGNITYANQKFFDISGYNHEELIGHSHNLLNSGHHPRNFFAEMWQTISTGKTWQGEIKNKSKDGDDYWVASTIAPMLDHSGLPNRYISIRTDITRQKQITESLRISEERLRRSQEAANIGNWDWDIQTGELFWSERIGALFGYDDVVDTTYENFIQAVHPDDRELVSSAVNACVEKSAEYDIEHRIVRSDGKVRWLSEKGDVLRSEDGTPLRMIGVVQDISRRKTTERLLDLLNDSTSAAIRSEEYSDIFEQMLVGLLELTHSAYGFIGEIYYTEEDIPYLKTNSITNIAWNDETRAFYADNAPDGMEFRNLNSLFGKVITTGNVVISNDPSNDPRAAGIPQGHPALKAFLGVPLYYGEKMIGMYGIANRPEGYDQEVVDFLQPFTTTSSSLIHARLVNCERIQDHQELKLSKDLAEKASRSKTEFLSRMSHELRTPLNAILGFGQLMESDSDDPLSESHQTSTAQILTAGWHLLELINEVLDLSKIEAGRLSISMEAVDACDVIRDCLKLTEQMAEQYNITISYQPEIQPLYIHADRIRFKQVYLNLLTNAIKYNRTGGTVTLKQEISTTKEVVFSINDTGYGIPEHKLSELFEPFNRLGAENTLTEGTGIGLVIAKRLTELMHGYIDVSSKVNVGTSFSIHLPQDDAITHIDSDVLQPELQELLQTSTNTAFRILYVEDNPANLKLVSNILQRIPNIILITATDGTEGLNTATDLLPDLILLDINLPGMSGMEICSALNNNPNTRDIPRIAISANAMPADVESAMMAGFNDYLTKPLDVKNFLTVINTYKSNTD